MEKEQRWLPMFAGQLLLSIPAPIAVGRPGSGYPWPWSIYRWIDGEPASVGTIADLSEFAADLARFLTALQAIDGADGPPPGEHSAHRGGPLGHFDDEEIPEAIQLLADVIDADAMTEVWQTALSSTWDQALLWMHGDVVGSNLLVSDGALAGVIDFGCAAVGDPACDLVKAWTFFAGDSANRFRSEVMTQQGSRPRMGSVEGTHHHPPGEETPTRRAG